MELLQLTLPTIAENLALDEALLEHAETGQESRGILRFWESANVAVVLGRSSAVDAETHSDYCHQNGIRIVRRCSGGAAVVVGPGCLMYSVILGFARFPQVELIENAHRFVLGTMLSGLGPLLPGSQCAGTSDLALGDRKFSGNSLRVKRSHLLYHGTLLYDFPLALISSCLQTAPRQPPYRAGRKHADFVGNIPLTRAAIEESLTAAWKIDNPCADWPRSLTEQLVAIRYGRREWNCSR